MSTYLWDSSSSSNASAVCGKTPQELENQHNDVMKKMFEDKFTKSVAQVVNVTQDNDVIIMMMTTSECKDVDEFMLSLCLLLYWTVQTQSLHFLHGAEVAS